MNGTNVLYARSLSKHSLIEAMEARRDGGFFRVVHSVSDIDNLRSDDTSMLYHRSAIRRTQVDEIAVSSRLSRRALIINQTHHRFPC